jgi:DNA-binding CsgD family transcriptional regulator
MKRLGTILLYGVISGLALCALSLITYRYQVIDQSTEIYILLISLLFTIVGVWAGLKFARPGLVERKTIIEVPSREGAPLQREELVRIYQLSQRELDVLVCLSEGLSNEEIAEKLFVSGNTVKTHLSNLYLKLDVKRRTQAIEKARATGILT